MKRLPNRRQVDAILSSLANIDTQKLNRDLVAAIEHERRAGSPHDGWSRGNEWASSTEAAAINRIDGHRGDWQRQQLDRLVERLVRAVAELSWIDTDLDRLRAVQAPHRRAS